MINAPSACQKAARVRIRIEGVVQGVGFRPFVYRIALETGVSGWVINDAQGLILEAEGAHSQLQLLRERLEREAPPHAQIQSIQVESITPTGERGFEIRDSAESGPKTALILPDLAVCAECLRETFDPSDRRYLYPFTNCTHCGPRFSIMLALPYDRPHTTMRGFSMCADCHREYEDPRDRRFHAQPIACPICGPQLALWDEEGRVLAERHEALLATVAALRKGNIAAIKGLGGFHLMVDAHNQDAVMRLRERKRREEKPFALMVADLESAKRFCHCSMSDAESRLMSSPASPITLLRRLKNPKENDVESSNRSAFPAPRSPLPAHEIPEAVAPGNPYLGVMLPYTPLHHILMREFGGPLVATSGNLSDEPICVDEQEALQRLHGIADLFLVHNRPIVRHMDDSVTRVLLGREYLMRRARGYAPLPIQLGKESPPLLATGAHQKNAIAITAGRNVFLSQHIGDLETKASLEAFEEVIEALQDMYAIRPIAAVRDLHPDYPSSRYAEERGVPTVSVQHHYAHVLSCLTDNQIDAPALGVAWDGTGLGLDGTIWGGEFLRVDDKGFERAAYFMPFALPGGEAAIKDIRRTALGALYEAMGEEAFYQKDMLDRLGFSHAEAVFLRSMLHSGVNCPRTSSVGRLFDAVAAFAGVRQRAAYEGQGAMELEWRVGSGEWGEKSGGHWPGDGERNKKSAHPPVCPTYSFFINQDERGAYVIDWRSMLLEIVDDAQREIDASIISLRFHQTLVEIIIAICRKVGERQVALSGGCFQNAWLLCESVERLQAEGFSPCWHHQVPANDGGIALGQIMGALRAINQEDAPMDGAMKGA